MSPASLFSIAGPVAMIGWVLLALSPLLPNWTQVYPRWIAPILFSAAYAVLIIVYAPGAEGGFSSLQDLATFFATPEILLAGWLHYLAFDLLIGCWEVRDAKRLNVPFWFVLPCLPLTFLLGPIGFLVYVVVRTIALRRNSSLASSGAGS